MTYLNHVTIATARNGTTTHTLHPDGTGGTVVDGSAFTPTSGRFLICVAEGAVTSTTPTGWTLPTNGSAINNTGLYVWYRTASGTSADQVATTHNASNYAVVFDFYEFAAGASFVGAATANAVAANGGAGPTLSGLTGTNWTAGIVAQGNSTLASSKTFTWNLGTEEVDHCVTRPTAGDTDGYTYSLTYVAGDTASSVSYAATISSSTDTCERLVIAVNEGSGPPTNVSRVAVTTGAPGAATAFSPTLPTHATDDRMILAVVGKYNTTTIPTINQSWVLVGSGTGGTGSAANDTGTTFWAVYAKDATSGSETAPTVTPGGTAPNSWEWVCATHRPASGMVWRDAIGASAAWVQSASDTSTASPLTGTAGAWTGVQPTTDDAIFAVGVIPTDLGTALGATTITATGLSGGTKDTTTTNYVENALNADTAAVWAGWTSIVGTASAGLALSFTVTGATNQSGSLIAVALRQQSGSFSGSAAPSWTATITAAGGLSGLSGSASRSTTASITAVGQAQGSASLNATATITAAGGLVGAGPSVAVFESAWNTTTTPKTVVVTDAEDGDYLLVVAGGDQSSGNPASACTTTTTVGTTTAWAEILEDFDSGTNVDWFSTAWTEVTATGAVTVSVARTKTGSTGGEWGFYVIRARNSAGIGVSGALGTAGSTEVISLTVAQNSVVTFAEFDWTPVSPATAWTPSGQTVIEATQIASIYTVAAAYWLDQAAGTRNYGTTNSASSVIKAVAVELLAAAGGSFSGSASLNATATISGAGRTEGSASRSTTATVTSTGQARGSASLSETATVIASGQGQGSASLNTVATITAAGNMSAAGTASVAETASITGSGRVEGSANPAWTASITAAGGLGALSGSASLTASASLNASGQVQGSSSSTWTASITAAGVLTASGSAAVSETASILSSGRAQGTSSLSGLVSTTAIGAGQGAVAVTGTASISSTGRAQGSASPTWTATISAEGGPPGTGSAALNAVATITASGVLSASGSASLSETASITALGAGQGSVSRSTTASISSSGQVQGSSSPAWTSAISPSGRTEGSAASTWTATITAAGNMSGGALSGTSDSTWTATISAAGQLQGSGAATVLTTATITAAGVLTASGSAARNTVAAITASGQIQGSASRSTTATVTASGRTENSASVSATVSITASGRLTIAGSASLNAVATIIAAGYATGVGILPPAPTRVATGHQMSRVTAEALMSAVSTGKQMSRAETGEQATRVASDHQMSRAETDLG